MVRHVTIDPITRLEGHGKIDIILDDAGNVDRAYLQVPELRGFEQFLVGRPVEDAAQITSRICGVCPMAHHMAASKAVDDVFKVECAPTGRLIRELCYNTFTFEDHALHFYFLGGPDFVVGPDAPRAERNILGVLGKVGLEVGKQVIAMRREARQLVTTIAGKIIHPVFGLPGGVARRVSPEEREQCMVVAEKAVEFSLFTLQVFRDVVLANEAYVDAIVSDGYTHRTYYMGLVDEQKRLNLYDGKLRVVDPDGKEFALFPARDYREHIDEHVEPWSYIKFPYLKQVGWQGFEEGSRSGVYAVAPLARLNAAEGMTTPRAQEAYEEFYQTLGARPVHHTLATHWARLVELVNAAERMVELARREELCGEDIRTIPTQTPTEGVGVVEAPRGTLFHHYATDENGIITMANLIVATQNNAARIAMSVDRAARTHIRDGNVDDGILNLVEMAYRAYDPCHGCATHALPGQQPVVVRLYGPDGTLQREIRRDDSSAR